MFISVGLRFAVDGVLQLWVSIWCLISEAVWIQQLFSCKHAFLPPNILGIITLGTVQCELYAWNSFSTPKLDHLVILVLRTHALCQNFYLLGLLTFLCIVGVHNLQHLTSFTVYPLTVRHCYDDCHHRIFVSELDRVYVQFYLIIPSRLMVHTTSWTRSDSRNSRMLAPMHRAPLSSTSYRLLDSLLRLRNTCVAPAPMIHLQCRSDSS